MKIDCKRFFLVFYLLIFPTTLYAQALPGPADISRIKPEEKIMAPDRSKDQQVAVPTAVPLAQIPEAAKSFHFTLNMVNIEGITAFTSKEMADIYAPYIHKDVSLDIIYVMANAITARYHNAGYFLSRAYIPGQSIKNGNITIKVIEGYIGEVELQGGIKSSHIVKKYIKRLIAQKPVNINFVESFLLRLNDLPGYSFRAVLEKLETDFGA
jgi:hemolysin activation/secretion protein